MFTSAALMSSLSETGHEPLQVVVEVWGCVLVLSLLDPEDYALFGKATHQDVDVTLALTGSAVARSALCSTAARATSAS
jgi:hypothetical protein